MIIDSGFDFLYLALKQFTWDTPARSLIVLRMDGDLGYFGSEVISADFDGDFDAVAAQILHTIDEDFVRYYAIVEQCESLPAFLDTCAGDDEYRAGAKRLEAAASALGLVLVSHVYVTETEWNSTGPMHSFKSYPLAKLPKIVSERPGEYAGTRRAGGGDFPPTTPPALGSHPQTVAAHT